MKHRLRLAALALTATTAAATAMTVSAGAAESAGPEPALKYRTTKTSVTLARSKSTGKVWLSVPVQLVAGSQPFELWLKRASYTAPITAVRKHHGAEKPLPEGLFTDFRGLPDFTHVRVTNSAGKHVVQQYARFCPNHWEPARTRPDSPDRSPYPADCPGNQFTLGAVFGLQAGWSVPWSGSSPSMRLAEGKYTLTLTMAKRYRDLFDVPMEHGQLKLRITVKNGYDDGPPHGDFPHAARQAVPSQPAANEPTGQARVPDGPHPNLRSLPAWGVRVSRSPGRTKQYLNFAANVWNEGPSPLVVDGFRRSGEEIMDAYQYFYDADGNQVGYDQAGTMEWDARDGHDHWHFTDFAQYRLLDKDKQLAVRSKKEAFCLANTDAVDYTVPNANWKPYGTDLHTACGWEDSLSVREVLDVGSGDTYSQSTPGQNFDITNVPNGTYYIEVRANPRGALHETSTDDNVSYRKVILGGTKTARTVKMPPYSEE